MKFSISHIGVVANGLCWRHFCHFIVSYYSSEINPEWHKRKSHPRHLRGHAFNNNNNKLFVKKKKDMETSWE